MFEVLIPGILLTNFSMGAQKKEYDCNVGQIPLTCPPGIHSSKKGKAALRRPQGKGFGWQKRKALEKSNKFKKWKTVSKDKRQFSR